jgi:ketosteroid isomerase-like protein
MDLVSEIDDLTARFVAAFNRGDAAGAASAYAESAIFANPGPVVVSGRDQIRAAFQEEHRRGLRLLGFETLQADGDGLVAWALQRFPSTEGDTIVMIALRHDAAGWSITAETVTA